MEIPIKGEIEFENKKYTFSTTAVLVNSVTVEVKTPDELFIEACGARDAFGIHQMSNETLNEKFFEACINKNEDLAKQLYGYGARLVDENLDVLKWALANHMVGCKTLKAIFVKACKNGNIEVVKWALEIAYIKQNAPFGKIFHTACEANNLEMVKLLSKYYTIRIDFINTCSGGDLDLAKFLYSTGLCNDNLNEALNVSCKAGQFEVAKWLHELGAKLE